MRRIGLSPDVPVDIGSPIEFVFTAEQIEAIASALAELPWVREAHLPAIGREQALLVVSQRGEEPDVDGLTAALGEAFDSLGVAFLAANDPRLPSIRALDTTAYRGPEGSAAFHALFLDHVGAVLDRGLALEAWLGEHEQRLDLEAGKLLLRPSGRFFARTRKLAAQVIGVESVGAGTFTWAWADPQRTPPSLARAADVVRRRGIQNQIPELESPTVLLDDVGAVPLSIVACGVLRATAFCRVEAPDVVRYVAITDPVSQVERVPAGEDVAEVIDLFGHWPLRNARSAVESFAKARGLALEVHGPRVVLTGSDGDSVSLRFDARGRIRSVSRTLA